MLADFDYFVEKEQTEKKCYTLIWTLFLDDIISATTSYLQISGWCEHKQCRRIIKTQVSALSVIIKEDFLDFLRLFIIIIIILFHLSFIFTLKLQFLTAQHLMWLTSG